MENNKTLKFINELKVENKEANESTVMTNSALQNNLANFKRINPEFTFDENNIELVINLLHYFHNLNYKLNLNKGLFLYGNVGVGKTYILNAFNKYAKRIKIDDKKGFTSFKATSVETLILKQSKDILSTNENLLVDEIGIEKDFKVLVFGTSASNYIDLVLMELYADKFLKGKKIHITSNFTPKEIDVKYNRRLTDRFIEMFNFVEVRGKSRRK